MKTKMLSRWIYTSACALTLTAAVASTGCQVSLGGQTLPSPWYMTDDVQYFAPGSEFKLPNEAARLEANRADAQLPPGNVGAP